MKSNQRLLSLFITGYYFFFNFFQPIPVFAALNSPQIIGVSPSSPSPVGTCITVSAKVQWDSEFRSMRIRFGNEGWQEEATPEFSRKFCTSNYSPGWYTIRVEVAKVGDNSWSNPTSTEARYQLIQTSQPPSPTSPPSSPQRGPGFADFSLNPSSGVQVGQTVQVHIKVNSSNPGAIRIFVPCGNIAHFEHTLPEYSTTWTTGGCGPGSQEVRACARDVNDTSWQNPTCLNRSAQFSAPQSSAPNIPKVNFWVNNATITQGACTVLHWQSSDASSVNIDGEIVSLSGEKNVCPSVTKHYSLKAAGPGGESTRSLSVVVNLASSGNVSPQNNTGSQNPAPQVNANSYFKNGDIIIIGFDIYVINNGQRRLVPNPQTLDALGISRSWINNKGLSEAELLGISRGEDIPDVNRDSGGFQQFSNQAKSSIQSNQNNSTNTSGNSNPISNDTSTGIPIVVLASNPQEFSLSTIVNKFMGEVGKVLGFNVEASDTSAFEKNQCTDCAAKWSNAETWLFKTGKSTKASEWANRAENANISVTRLNSNAVNISDTRNGDILVWSPSCENADKNNGHVAIIRGFDSNNEKPIIVDECNWGCNLCESKGNPHKLLPCMSIIHVGTGEPLFKVEVQSRKNNNIFNNIWNFITGLFK